MTMLELRQKTGLNRAEFAEILEIPVRTIQDWELNKRTPPQYIVKLVAFYLRQNSLLQEGGTSVLALDYNKRLFEIEKGVLVRYKGKGKTAAIPDCVTAIGMGAFSGASIKSVEIPNSVTMIGERAFSCCMGLETVSIPDSVTVLGFGAFSNCRSLRKVKIPSAITEIPDQLFLACEELAEVILPQGATSIGAGAFYACEKLTKLEHLENITQIGKRAFLGCAGLNVGMKEKICAINADAFLR